MSLTPYVHVHEALAGAVSGTVVTLTSAETHHLKRVLRLADGAHIEVADGNGGHATARLADNAVELSTDAAVEQRRRPTIVVAQALNKGRKFDEVLRQVGELGADVVVPLVAERNVVKLDAKATRTLERWQAVARATAEQSRQPFRTQVTPVRTIAQLPEVLAHGYTAPPVDVRQDAAVHDGEDLRLVAVPGAPALLGQLHAPESVDRVTIAVGPEGGFSEHDLAGFAAAGFAEVGMGPTVLRTEHAAPTAVAVLAAVMGRW